MTITELRKNIYAVFDQVAAGAGPVRLERNGVVIVIARQEPSSRLMRLQKPLTKAFLGNSDEVIGMSWEREWSEQPT